MTMDSKIENKKVLITGYSGFTGKLLGAHLTENNFQVFGLVVNDPVDANEYKTDITNYEDLLRTVKKIQPDYVVHLAAIAHVVNSDPEYFYKVNLFGTLNLLQALADTGLNPKKIIIASSAYVYGNCPQEYIDEAVYPQPTNHYGASKLAMEHLVATWFDRFSIIIIRPFNYTGTGQSAGFLIPKIIENFQSKKSYIELGNMNVTRDISAVNFVIEVYLRLLKSNLHSEIFNICSGTGHNITDILAMMSKISGHEIEVKLNAEFSRKNEIYHLVGSNKKLFAAIGQVPVIHLSEILENMYFLLSPLGS